MFSQAQGTYEGITLVPMMYSNARNQDAFAKNISLSLAIIASTIILYAPFAIMAYQSKIQEIILLNLEFGQA